MKNNGCIVEPLFTYILQHSQIYIDVFVTLWPRFFVCIYRVCNFILFVTFYMIILTPKNVQNF